MQSNKQTVDLGKQAPTVLIVEDEVLVRAAVAKYLREYGFEVLEAVAARMRHWKCFWLCQGCKRCSPM